MASINSGLPYINPNHAKVFMAGKVVSQEQLDASHSEHRAAESSETKFTENLSTKELLGQQQQFALQYSKKKLETLGRNASQKNWNSEM